MNRYSRHTVLPEIGETGQEKIREGSILVIGLGGLGATMAETLVRCGIGHIEIVDRDFVELSNLQRQTLYDEADIGKPKSEVSHDKLKKVNSDVDIASMVVDVNPSNIDDLMRDKDIVLDATDNMKTRYLINDACVKNNVPWIYSAVLGTYGMTMNFVPGKGPCLGCLISEEPDPGKMDTCATAGILFTLPRFIANIAATEAVKYIIGSDIRRTLLTVDIWKSEFDMTTVRKNDSCDCCVKRDFRYLEGDEDMVTELCGRDAVQVSPVENINIDMDAFLDRYEEAERYGRTMIKLEVEDYILNLFKDGRLIVKGTNDIGKAKSLYSEYIGR